MNLNDIFSIMVLYLIFLSFFFISTRKSYIIFNYRFYLRDPTFKGLFESKEIREKRKKLGQIFFAISWAGLILFGVIYIFFPTEYPTLYLYIIEVISFVIGIVFFFLSGVTYIKAIQDEVLEEFMSQRKRKKSKDLYEKEIIKKRKKLKTFFTLACTGYILFAILYIFFPIKHPIILFMGVVFLFVGIVFSILFGNLFLYIKENQDLSIRR